MNLFYSTQWTYGLKTSCNEKTGSPVRYMQTKKGVHSCIQQQCADCAHWSAVAYGKWSHLWWAGCGLEISICLQKPIMEAYEMLQEDMVKMFFHNPLHFGGLNSLRTAVFDHKAGESGSSSHCRNEIMINRATVIVWRKRCWVTVDGMAKMVHVSYSSGKAFTVLHDHLNMRHMRARWVSRYCLYSS